jgi:hypothetical protein
MSRGTLTFKKTDVTRATKAVLAAGLNVARVEIAKNGSIVVVSGKPSDTSSDAVNPWDEVIDAAEQKRAS